MRTGSVLVCVLVAAAILGSVALVGSATTSGSGFQMSVSNSVDIPPRTVTIEGDDFEVSAVAQRFPGDSLAVEVTAPSADTEYDVNLYNSDGMIEQAEAMTGSGTATFDTDSLTAGSYYAAVYYDGNTVKIHPVVIAAYEVTLDIPSTAEPGSTVAATISITRRTRDQFPDVVRVVIADEQHDLQVNTTEKTSGTYTADVTVDLPEGEYVAYGVARGEDELDTGEMEVVGHSDGYTFRVATPTPTPTPTPTAMDSTDDGDTPTATLTQTPPATTPTPSPTATPTPSVIPSPTATPSSTEAVITPGSPTSPTSPTTDGTTPGFGLLLSAVALAVLVILYRLS